MQLTIPKAAKLYKKHRSTIHRHIEKGLVSCAHRPDGTRVIDLSELIRFYGEPATMPPEMQPDPATINTDMQQVMLQELQALRAEVAELREEVKSLKMLPAPQDQQQEALRSPRSDDKQGEDRRPVTSIKDILAKLSG